MRGIGESFMVTGANARKSRQKAGRLPAWLAFRRDSRNRRAYSENGHSENTHVIRACTARVACSIHEPAKVSWEGTQLEVACGKKLCKAVCQIKNADAFTKRSAGAGTGGLGISANDQFRIFYKSEQPVGVALWELADDLVAKRIDGGDRRLTAVE